MAASRKRSRDGAWPTTSRDAPRRRLDVLSYEPSFAPTASERWFAADKRREVASAAADTSSRRRSVTAANRRRASQPQLAPEPGQLELESVPKPVPVPSPYELAVRRLENNAQVLTRFAIANWSRLEDFTQPEHPVSKRYISTMLRLADTVMKKALVLYPEEFTMDKEKAKGHVEYLGDKLEQLRNILGHVRYISFRELCDATYANVALLLDAEPLRDAEYCIMVTDIGSEIRSEKSNMLFTLLAIVKLRPRFAVIEDNSIDKAALKVVQEHHTVDCLLFDDCIYSGTQMNKEIGDVMAWFKKCQVHCVPAFYHISRQNQRLNPIYIHPLVREAVLKRSASLRFLEDVVPREDRWFWSMAERPLTYLQIKAPDDLSFPTYLWTLRYSPFASTKLKQLYTDQIEIEGQEMLSIAENCKGIRLVDSYQIDSEFKRCPYHWYKDVMRDLFFEVRALEAAAKTSAGGRSRSRRTRSRKTRSRKSRSRKTRSRSRVRARTLRRR